MPRARSADRRDIRYLREQASRAPAMLSLPISSIALQPEIEMRRRRRHVSPRMPPNTRSGSSIPPSRPVRRTWPTRSLIVVVELPPSALLAVG